MAQISINAELPFEFCNGCPLIDGIVQFNTITCSNTEVCRHAVDMYKKSVTEE